MCVPPPVMEEILSTYSCMLERIKQTYQTPVRFTTLLSGSDMSMCVTDQEGTVLWCESLMKAKKGDKENDDTTNSKRR